MLELLSKKAHFALEYPRPESAACVEFDADLTESYPDSLRHFGGSASPTAYRASPSDRL